jgi:XTP/dITP diphosphohydrolase
MVDYTSAILVVGSYNRKKGLEMAELLAPLGLTLKTLAEFPEAIEVEEHGSTFAENAALKAGQQAKHLGRWVVADDSGLEVAALGGAPGVLSARYSGTGATDASNNQLLLERLAGAGLEKRSARYVCRTALADPTGAIRATTEDYCRGRILLDHHGSHGFGYDPLFEVVEYHRTFGELGLAVKSCISHRARAIRLLIPTLRELIAAGEIR